MSKLMTEKLWNTSLSEIHNSWKGEGSKKVATCLRLDRVSLFWVYDFYLYLNFL